MEFFRRLIQAVLCGRGHGRPAQAQYVGHQALVLPQLLGLCVLVPVVRVARRIGVPAEVQQVGPDRQTAEDRKCGDGGDDGGEKS
ncbi:hypothetical protein [Streptomyces anandii]|uniref:hypothetical protein n=1 Tax=Streptomyces anandii TaxID=285454 RepID=UPI003675EE5B